MSQFEYVSIAIALVYSFAIARLVGSVSSVFAADRRYWVHIVWLGVILFASISTWWGNWSLREVEWNTLRFVWALLGPALIHARVTILVSEAPGSVASWRDHYFANRVLFFAIGVAISLNGFLIGWVMGLAPWGAFTVYHPPSAILLTVSLIGLVTERPAVHGGLAVANLTMVVSGLVWQHLN